MTLPTTFHQAEIAQAEWLAEQLVQQLLTKDLLQIGVPILSADVESRMIKNLFQDVSFFRAEILQAALNGCWAARVALGELVQEVEESKQMSELKTFAKACANPHFKWPTRPGGQRIAHIYSDVGVVMVVLELARRFPKVPTTGHSARQTNHCDIAAGAFSKYGDRTGLGKMTREKVKKIWLRYKKLRIRGISDTKVSGIFNTLPGAELGV